MQNTFHTAIQKLKDYSPANPHVTSGREIEQIKDALELDTLTHMDLVNLRDIVVL